jgi:hypothetical protein
MNTMKVYLDADGRHWIAEVNGERLPRDVRFESEAEAWHLLLQLALDPSAAFFFEIELEKQSLH